MARFSASPWSLHRCAERAQRAHFGRTRAAVGAASSCLLQGRARATPLPTATARCRVHRARQGLRSVHPRVHAAIARTGASLPRVVVRAGCSCDCILVGLAGSHPGRRSDRDGETSTPTAPSTPSTLDRSETRCPLLNADCIAYTPSSAGFSVSTDSEGSIGRRDRTAAQLQDSS